MGTGPLPIGSLHVRDFDGLRTQRTLAELKADAHGLVQFRCLKCPRTEAVPMAVLTARFRATAGLVDILNALAPADCPQAGVDVSGNHPCGFCYGELKEVLA
jgi:hypothetical protein